MWSQRNCSLPLQNLAASLFSPDRRSAVPTPRRWCASRWLLPLFFFYCSDEDRGCLEGMIQPWICIRVPWDPVFGLLHERSLKDSQQRFGAQRGAGEQGNDRGSVSRLNVSFFFGFLSNSFPYFATKKTLYFYIDFTCVNYFSRIFVHPCTFLAIGGSSGEIFWAAT